MTGQQNYSPGEIIEYTSFDESGYSRAEVIRYAPAEEQWQVCPNCEEQAVPAPGRHHGFQACPRCGAFVRWPDLPPLLYVQTVTPPRCSPFLVRETQTRRPGQPTTEFPSLEAFHDDRPERRTSGEADYGVRWRNAGLDWPKWRVSYIQATGEIYAVRLSSGPERWAGMVKVLGVVPPDPTPGPGAAGSAGWHHDNRYYRTLDAILDGWADPDVSGHDLAWVVRKLASA